MSHKYEITPDVLEEIATREAERMKTEGFIPDHIVGLSLGGSIVGIVLAENFGCDFSIDYRKNRHKYGPESVKIKLGQSKILIVEDIADLAQSLLSSAKDILKDLYPSVEIEKIFRDWLNNTSAPSKGEYRQKLMNQFPNHQIKLFALIYDPRQSQIDPDYFGYADDISGISESWKLNTTETTGVYSSCKYPWGKKVSELFDNRLLTTDTPAPTSFHTECPFTKNRVIECKDSRLASVQITLQPFLGDNPVCEDVFFENCEKAGFTVSIGKEGAPTIFKDDHGMPYYFDVEHKKTEISLSCDEQNQCRTFGDRPKLMCSKCPIKPPPEREFCIACNHYVRIMETLRKLVGFFRVIDCRTRIDFTDGKSLTRDRTEMFNDLYKIEERRS